jgi:FtsH-binding integral membrane protein
LTRVVPINYILLLLFTVCEAYMVASVAAQTDPKIVLQAAGMTSLIVIALTIFAMCTSLDFVLWGPVLIVIISMSIMMSLLFMFVFMFHKMHALWCGIGVMIYSIYLVIDT